MKSLVQVTIDAHGGFECWRRSEHVSAHLRNGGILWTLKNEQDVLDDVNVRVALRRECASHSPFLKPDLRTSFEPQRVAIETTDRHVVEERLTPRDSFAGHGIDTPWDPLPPAYFAGYAMWTYLTTPFLFAMDGVATEELEPRRENGEMWRLKATFPPAIATHSTVPLRALRCSPAFSTVSTKAVVRRPHSENELAAPRPHGQWTSPTISSDY